MKISVIIPVYNASRFVTKAVGSALEQPETAEVILIEDGSPDGSLVVCEHLANKYDKVRLLRHPGGKNRGAGASRNLGMKNAQHDFIAFLDADDYYLPMRFDASKKIFSSDPLCEGVYEAIGKNYENEQAKRRWCETGMSQTDLTTMSKVIAPEDLFTTLLLGSFGYFSINGLIVKRSMLKKSGFMNEKLKIHEDTDFIYKLALVGKLKPGRLDEPVAIRRVHLINRISAPRTKARKYQDLMRQRIHSYRWLKDKMSPQQHNLMINKMIVYCKRDKHFKTPTVNIIPRSLLKKIRLVIWIFEFPEIITKSWYWKELFSKI